MKIVIIGGGFAGINLTKVDIPFIIDPNCQF